MAEHHELMGGRLHIYRRENSRYWQCSTYLNGRNWRASTRDESLAHAKDFAEDWYLGLKGKSRAGILSAAPAGPTFLEGAKVFLKEYPIITHGQRNPYYVKQLEKRLNKHILPFMGDMAAVNVLTQTAVDYRIHRHEWAMEKYKKAPARSTLHQEMVIVRQVLKTCLRLGWIDHIPNLSPPYKMSGKVGHRAWFSPDEYKTFYKKTRELAKNPPQDRWRESYEHLHDYCLVMANTGLRPDEGKRVELRDVAIITDEATGERILLISVRGKRGVGYCKSMPGAVFPFTRIKNRERLEPNDKVLGQIPSKLLNNVLDDLKMKFDRDGNRRTSYSFRHTYISMRLLEGADIYQLAKNCRTSVEMIEKHYAVHIHNTLDAAAINVRKPKKKAENADEPAKKNKNNRSRRK